jgi:hypothetical protein
MLERLKLEQINIYFPLKYNFEIDFIFPLHCLGF